MTTRTWTRIGMALALLVFTAGDVLAETLVSHGAPELGGGVNFSAWANETPQTEEDFSGTLFEPVEETAKGVYEINEGLLGHDNLLFPTWEEIKKQGGLKKTFHF